MTDAELFTRLTEAVLAGDMDSVPVLCEEAVAAHISPMTIINHGMAPGAVAAGQKFSHGEYFLPQLVMAGEAMKAGLDKILPLITAEARAEGSGVVILGSVEGDVHDIGKNIVSALLSATGFHVVDLGVDVAPAAFVERAVQEGAQIVAMGSYMSTTLPAMKSVIDGLAAAGLHGRVKVMVGGAAVTAKYATSIGADGYAVDAPQAVELAKSLIGGA